MNVSQLKSKSQQTKREAKLAERKMSRILRKL